MLVCGDLNDTMEAATTQLVFGPPGSQIGTGGFDHSDHGDHQRLWDVGYAMNPPNDYSPHQPGPSRTHRSRPGLPGDDRPPDRRGDRPLDIPSIGFQLQVAPRTDPPSDHRPVVAHFDL